MSIVMAEELVVVLGGSVAGRLTRHENGRVHLEYDEAYRERPDATPLSLSMPIQVRAHADDRRRQTVTNYLWGLLPDSEAVLDRWARHYQVTASSAFALLGTPIGEDCAGAVAFCRAGDLDRLLARPGTVHWLDEAEVAGRLRDLRRDATAWLGRRFTGQFSLAGAQAKTALLYRDGRWGQPSGAMPTTHILKPAVSGLDDHDLNEHLCLDAARRADLIAARSWIATFEDQTAVVVARYDRRVSGDKIERIHQEDLCQALSIPPGRKYQNQGGPTPWTIAALFRRSMAPAAADDAVARFADALIWNWIIAGTDAHAKNYSLLLSGPEVRLAPLYDIASALPYGTHERKLRLAMKVGDEYAVHLQRNTWPRAAQELGIDADRLVSRVRDLAAAAPAAFADAAAAPEVVALGRTTPATLVDLVAERARRCAALVA